MKRFLYAGTLLELNVMFAEWDSMRTGAFTIESVWCAVAASEKAAELFTPLREYHPQPVLWNAGQVCE